MHFLPFHSRSICPSVAVYCVYIHTKILKKGADTDRENIWGVIGLTVAACWNETNAFTKITIDNFWIIIRDRLLLFIGKISAYVCKQNRFKLILDQMNSGIAIDTRISVCVSTILLIYNHTKDQIFELYNPIYQTHSPQCPFNCSSYGIRYCTRTGQICFVRCAISEPPSHPFMDCSAWWNRNGLRSKFAW